MALVIPRREIDFERGRVPLFFSLSLPLAPVEGGELN